MQLHDVGVENATTKTHAQQKLANKYTSNRRISVRQHNLCGRLNKLKRQHQPQQIFTERFRRVRRPFNFKRNRHTQRMH